MIDLVSRLDAGDVVAGRYCVESPLGHGGAATVYRVRDARTGRQLALKQLRVGEGAGALAHAALFEQEYHTLCQLAHPRIIEVYDYGLDPYGAFYTMELLDGADLQAVGVVPWRRACELLCDVASSLAIIHSRRLVHRDVSARNVRCTSDGRAKLIDFGALAPMGVARPVVGTAPYLAPEALERLGLDGRADLYALGALSYWLLTGYHAYHARSVSQVRNLWRSPPLPVTQYQPTVPAALDQLVMELLQLERTARPSIAAEVMERLCGIAGLPMAELPGVKRSYLVMPGLVAREDALQRVREVLRRASEGTRGSSLVIEGDAGTGRSRMLDACVLEARLLGMLVVRGDRSDSATGDYGLIRSLCDQLWEAAPDICEQALRLDATLASVLPAAARGQLPSHAAVPALPSTPTARKKLLSALQRLLLASAQRKPLLCAVDDLDAIDEPSAAWCGMLANAARRARVTVIATSHAGGTPTPALALLRDLERPIALQPLDVEQTEALLRSVFGDVDHVAALAERMHGVALGNVRWTMTLAEHLVERDFARYEAGSWTLRARLGASDLPESLSAALVARLRRVGPDARSLAEVLALTDPIKLSIERYPLLLDEVDPARCHHALGELVAAAILLPSGERYRFAQDDLALSLRSELDHARQCALHARIAQALAGSDDTALRIHHLLLGGQDREALEQFFPLLDGLVSMYSPHVLPMCERALVAVERLGLPAEVQLTLHTIVLSVSANEGDAARFFRFGPRLLDRLCLECGLQRALALPDAVDGAQHDSALPPLSAPMPPEHSRRLLGRVCGAYATMASVIRSPELLSSVPDLEPLAATCPMLQIWHRSLESTRALMAGWFARARQHAVECLEQLQSQDPRDLDPLSAGPLADGMRYTLALYDATLGSAMTARWLPEIQQRPGLRANAARIRMVYELMHGNTVAAEAQRRRAELLALQDGEMRAFPNTTVRIELLAFVFADNLLGVKRTIERIEAIAAVYPGWSSTLSIGRAHYRRLQGDLQGALLALEPALACALHGRDHDWPWAVGTQVALITALGRHQEALELALRYLDMDHETRFAFSQAPMTFALCEALAHGGRGEQARAMIERFITAHRALGARGLRLGLAYETAARVALSLNDEAGFNHCASLCAEEYKGGRDLLLKAKHQRLLEEAAGCGTARVPLPSA